VFAGMMPTLERPGVMRPGQFGPMIRVPPLSWAYWKNAAVSCTGTPSVMTTTSGTPASTASTTAALVPLAGTKITDTSAPVFSTASATESNTGWSTSPSNSTVWPPLPGVTPPTIFVPDVSMRWVCLRPSEPVMPCTRTLLSCVSQIAIGSGPLSLAGGGQLGRPAGGVVHGLDALDRPARQRGCEVVQDLVAEIGVVAVEADDDRQLDRRARLLEQLVGLQDPVGHGVAGGDAAEDVHEDALDLRVRQDDREPVGHDLRAGAAADVQEVGRLHPAELLTGIGDDVEGAHHQAGAVADDADLAVEL